MESQSIFIKDETTPQMTLQDLIEAVVTNEMFYLKETRGKQRKASLDFILECLRIDAEIEKTILQHFD